MDAASLSLKFVLFESANALRVARPSAMKRLRMFWYRSCFSAASRASRSLRSFTFLAASLYSGSFQRTYHFLRRSWYVERSECSSLSALSARAVSVFLALRNRSTAFSSMSVKRYLSPFTFHLLKGSSLGTADISCHPLCAECQNHV